MENPISGSPSRQISNRQQHWLRVIDLRYIAAQPRWKLLREYLYTRMHPGRYLQPARHHQHSGTLREQDRRGRRYIDAHCADK